jgi:hypothetical protein
VVPRCATDRFKKEKPLLKVLIEGADAYLILDSGSKR